MVKFEMGNVKRTPKQLKKHISQMNDKEINFLHNKLLISLNRGNKITASLHLLNKVKNNEVQIDSKAILDCVNNFRNTLIEYNEHETFKALKRVVLRSQYAYNVMVDDLSVPSNLIIVIDLNTLEVVTAYNNAVSDNHATINATRYKKNLRIIK